MQFVHALPQAWHFEAHALPPPFATQLLQPDEGPGGGDGPGPGDGPPHPWLTIFASSVHLFPTCLHHSVFLMSDAAAA